MKIIMKLSCLTLFFIFTSFCFAQDRNAEYEEFRRQRTQEFNNWRTQANAEFTEYLSQAWEEFLVQTGRKDPIGPIPDEPTYYDDSKKAIPKSHGAPMLEDIVSPAMTEPLYLSAEYHSVENDINVDFFGEQINVPFDASLKISFLLAKEKDVAVAWKSLSDSKYMPTVDAISNIQKEYSLSDWATYKLIQELSESVYSESDANQRILTQMFLMCQLKYKIRIGSAGDELVLLIPFKESVYQIQYISEGDQDFFIFGYARVGSNTPLYSFKEDFSASENLICLTISKPMPIGGEDGYKKVKLSLWSSIFGEDVYVPVNKHCISMTLDYPQSDLLIYHHSVVDSKTENVIIRKIKYNIIKERMNDQEAVSYILNLIQKGFEYKTDYEMFGRSKPLFIEESIYYGANNCKDRVVLFSWLVKNILELNTVMLGYPSHVACGVEFKEKVEGDSFSYSGADYVVCDPTYIGAPIGATMPKFRGIDPSCVKL